MPEVAMQIKFVANKILNKKRKKKLIKMHTFVSFSAPANIYLPQLAEMRVTPVGSAAAVAAAAAKEEAACTQ